ncbi:unnamed protein product, partial [Effrenium voratum]
MEPRQVCGALAVQQAEAKLKSLVKSWRQVAMQLQHRSEARRAFLEFQLLRCSQLDKEWLSTVLVR